MLPDYAQRNELRFKVLPSVPYNVRVLVILGLWAAGLAIQALGHVLPGGAFVLAGTIMALTRGYSNEPAKSGRRKTRWENVTLEQFGRIAALDAESREWDRSAWIDATNAWGCLLGLMLAGVIGLVSLALAASSPYLAQVCVVDGVALFAPFWVTGIRRLYHRTELMIRVHALQNILDRLEKPDARGLMPTPMLELEKTKEGDLPHDVKLMVRFDDAPDGFMGIQVQVSLNDVQGTKYPYLYCVVLAKPGFGLDRWDASSEWKARYTKILLESQRTDEVELIVVRQQTTRQSGYHTKKAAQIRVFDAAASLCRQNLRSHS